MRRAALVQAFDAVGARGQRESRGPSESDLQLARRLDPNSARKFAARGVEFEERLQSLDDARPTQRMERGVGEQRRERRLARFAVSALAAPLASRPPRSRKLLQGRRARRRRSRAGRLAAPIGGSGGS